MKSLAEQMSVYSAYHRNPVNKAIHFVFVPAIVWTLMIAFGLVDLFSVGALTFTLAHALVVPLLVWYLLLDFPLGAVAVFLYTTLLILALFVGALGTTTALVIAGTLHVFSWAVQFLGHGVWEKRRPALMDNLFQTLVAPIFVIAEVAFMMGLRKDLEAEVAELMVEHLPEAERAKLQAAGA